MGSFYVPPRDKLLWYGVDLDGTLAEPVWPDPGIGDPIYDNVEKLLEIVEAGYKPRIHTSRTWADYEMIVAWLKEHNLWGVVRGIECGKPLYHRYVDDKSVNASEDSWL